MANNIELITKYSLNAWDLVYKQDAVTSLLDANPKMVQFTGAKTVKIGKLQTGGLHDYYRNNNAMGLGDTRVPQVPASGTNFVGASDFGYQKSNARLVWEEFTLRQDRAAAFEIEYFDDEESGSALVGLVTSETSRVVIIPEVDAYCLSTIAGYSLPAGRVTGTYTDPATAKPLAALNAAFVYFANHEVNAEDQVFFCSPTFMNALRNTNEVQKFMGQADYEKGKNVTFEIMQYQGRQLVSVSPERLRTNIVLGAEGYHWGAGSAEINFLAVAKSAVMHVVKYNKVKVISGEANLAARGFDGYTIFARIYHDVFVPDNKRVAIYLNTVTGTELAAEDFTQTVPVLEKTAKNTYKVIGNQPADKLAFIALLDDSETQTVGSPVAGTAIGIKSVGEKITVTSGGTNVYAIDSNKIILGKVTLAYES